MRPHVAEGQWITTNGTAMLDRGIDHAAIARRLDVAGWDAYPGAASAGHGRPDDYTAMCCDWLRWATGRPVKILETGIGPTRVDEDYLRLLHRHGADLVLFWHWRQHPGNVEQNSQPVCDYAGQPYADRLAFLKRITGDASLTEAGPADLSPRRAALLLDVTQYRWHLHPGPYGNPHPADYLDALGAAYAPLRAAGVAMDVIDWEADLSVYELLVVPSPRLMDEGQAGRLEAYVRGGGKLIVTGKACAMNRTGVYHAPPGGPMQGLLGVVARDEVKLKGPASAVLDGREEPVAVLAWVDRVEVTADDVLVLARFVGGAMEGTPALVHRRVGDGTVWYLAGPSEGLMGVVLSHESKVTSQK